MHSSAFIWARRVVALPIVLCAVALLSVVATTPASPSGLGYVAAIVVLAVTVGMERGARRRSLVMVAAAVIATTAVARVASAGGGGEVRMESGEDPSARWVNRLLDEQDLAVNGARALVWTRFVRDPDVPGLADVMRRAYERMRTSVGSAPSPVVATYLGLEAPGREDTLVVGDVATSRGVVVFLHGYAGSFTLPCWIVAEAAKEAGYATVCPSTRWVGDWWSADGAETLRHTLGQLRARGVKHVVLAGLSNGGVGASLLAPRFRGSLEGLVVISGASAEAGSPGVPVLALQGERDAQIPAAVVRAYAGRVSGHYVPLDAGHFALLMQEGRVHAAIASFLRALGGPPRRPAE